MISRNGNSLALSGRLTMETAADLYKTDLRPESGDAVEINFGQIEAVDSAAVSLLLCWLRRAQQENVTLHFSRLPENLLSLARLYGVAELLPAAGNDSALQS